MKPVRILPNERSAVEVLVLSRQRDESIMIGDDVEIIIVDVRGDKVRLGITAPKSIPVHRREIYDAIQREKGQKKEEAQQQQKPQEQQDSSDEKAQDGKLQQQDNSSTQQDSGDNEEAQDEEPP